MPTFLIGATFSRPRVGLAPGEATFSQPRVGLAPSGATFSQPRVGLAPSRATFSQPRVELAPGGAILTRGPFWGKISSKQLMETSLLILDILLIFA